MINYFVIWKSYSLGDERDMKSKIRVMQSADSADVIAMMRVFYSSPAVLSNGSEEIFSNDVKNCVNGNPYLEGYIMEDSDNIQGYAMIAKSFSTEFGKPCIWIEDLYIKEEYRGLGLGNLFMEFITTEYEDCIFRLEVEEENERAMKLYKKCGFAVLPYMDMKK